MEKELIEKYKERLQNELGTDKNVIFSREYQQFRKDVLPPSLTFYENVCGFCERLLKLKVKPGTAEKTQELIESAHLQVSPAGVLATSIILPVLFILLSVLIFLVIFDSLFFALFFFLIGVTGIIVLQKLPGFLASSWRMKSSNQMVLCIFYVVTYMRHTSNLERAIEFASEHLGPPLGLDLRKIVWDVENGKFENIRESLEHYLAGWKKYNLEFVESFHLIESSLFETSDERRLNLLEKSLDSMLDGTYEKMLHYAQNLKSPITMLHMLGVVLPILGLVILPLVVSFMEGVSWYHIAALYNIALPIIVYLLGRSILSKRPTGYGEVDISEFGETRKYRNILIHIGSFELQIHPIFISVILGCTFLFLGFLPLILHSMSPDFELTIFGFDLLGYQQSSKVGVGLIGPFGLWSSVLSLFIPFALAIAFGVYFRLRSKNVVKIREEGKKLEDEFASSLFQLGNRLGDGIPAEVAFEKVAGVLEDTTSGRFFKLVATNIGKLGMSVKDAIFSPKTGALLYFPSSIIRSSMKVLIESVKKGPKIAAQALLSVSRYMKEIHKVDERLKDLLSDVITDMKSQIAFLTPVIAGVVIAITSMITFILGSLSKNIAAIGQDQAGQLTQVAQFFGDSMPTYYFQVVVGVYVFQIVYLLTIMSNGIENGMDKLQERYLLGRNLMTSVVLYVVVAGLLMIVFNFIAIRIVDVAAVLGSP
ncbi:hypothetical protein COV18_04210 [Candidatus Woesearchaeota archaeon CG10_big_fil_rev_8_21_14_0_10_37_12]|nr:MAG: hypothetical protein COV18_04210 [Candidatus Woesearchaeota archaeon CG10_big_fil_rev_8_21_14_0_10_37_12]